MVKYLALAAALVVSLVAVDMAQAGRRCKSCGGGYAGGCPGGVCHIEYAPAPAPHAVPVPTAATNAPPAPVVVKVAPATQPAPVYYTNARRGLFGWRR
jgi:hypothetical protein